jgi:uncharacterized protein (TIGR00255 family)
MVHSMTGYAVASGDSPRGALALELRSVNSRYLDVQLRIADELRGAEPTLRELIVARIARGKVDCRLSLTDTGRRAQHKLDPQTLERLRQLQQVVRAKFPDAAPLGAADVLRWPGVLTEPPADEEPTRAAIERLCRAALEELCAAREREGAKLVAIVLGRIADMTKRLGEAAPLIPEATAAFKAKLEERLREALGAGNEERIRAEIALFATKTDVDEELTRLGVHIQEAERTLSRGGPVGKRLDFLAQEMNREANTLASKAAGLKISDCALELKLLIEQVREQVQNIE